jgi:hypothetical protein
MEKRGGLVRHLLYGWSVGIRPHITACMTAFKIGNFPNGKDFNIYFMIYQKMKYILMFSSQLHALYGSNTELLQ